MEKNRKQKCFTPFMSHVESGLQKTTSRFTTSLVFCTTRGSLLVNVFSLLHSRATQCSWVTLKQLDCLCRAAGKHFCSQGALGLGQPSSSSCSPSPVFVSNTRRLPPCASDPSACRGPRPSRAVTLSLIPQRFPPPPTCVARARPSAVLFS